MIDLGSNYSTDAEARNHVEHQNGPVYVKCHACFGSGLDRHGLGDCIECEGYGDIEVLD